MDLVERLRMAADTVMYPNGKPLPKSWGDSIRRNAEFSPDALNVGNKTGHLLFNPDPNLDFRFDGVQSFTTETYIVYQQQEKLLLLPKIIDREERKKVPGWGRAPDNYPGSVKGDLVWVTPTSVLELDRHYQNGVECDRTTSWVTIPWRPENTKNIYLLTTKALIYVAKRKFWHKQLDGGYSTQHIPALPSGIRAVPNHVVDPRDYHRKRR